MADNLFYKLPFANKEPYVWIFQATDMSKCPSNNSYTETDYKNDLTKLNITPEKAKKHLEKYSPSSYVQHIWLLTKELSDDTSKKWNKILRGLGYKGFIDYGSRFIHENEPYQAMFLDITAIKPIKLLNNSNKEHIINRYPNGNINREEYRINGKSHRNDGPACISYYENGNIKYQIYYLNGQRHCEGGHASIRYYENGNIEYQIYYLNGKYHRNDGPAYIEYYENGNIKNELYYLNGKWHRNDGPAVIRYYENGDIQYEGYYLNGNEIPLKTIETMIKELGIPDDHREWDQIQKDMFSFHFLIKEF